MAEVRLGSNENMKNINLGSIEIQEVYLGNILVWQNNQAPVYMELTWDGQAFSVPDIDDFDEFTGSASSTTFDGRTINIVITGISDLDNPDAADYIVGYRLQRPDGTYAAGDPASTDLNGYGAPIADYGEVLPGSTGTYDAVEDEFTDGSETIGTSTISVGLRDIDGDGVTVDSLTQEFVDDGNWILTVVDSRGGESDMATMDITLTYADTIPGITSSIALSSSIVNPILVPANENITLTATNAGGPLTVTEADRYQWACTSNCGPADTQSSSASDLTNESIVVTLPNNVAGTSDTSTWQLTTHGRQWNGMSTTDGVVSTIAFKAGPSLTAPSISVGSNLDCSPGAVISLSWSASSTNSIGTFVSWTPSGSGTVSGTCPTCVGTPIGSQVSVGTPSVFETRLVSGSNVNSLSGSGSGILRPSVPSASYTCVRSPGAPYRDESFSHGESSPTCTDTTPATYTFTAAESNGSCRIATPVSIGASNAVCAGGLSCGTFTATCGTVTKNSTVTVGATGCTAPSFVAPDYASGSIVNGSTMVNGNIGFFNVYFTLSAVRNASPYTPLTGSIPVTATCTGSKGTCVATRSASNGGGNVAISNHFVTIAQGDCDIPGLFTPGDVYNCSASMDVGFHTVTGTRTYSGGSQNVTIG